MGWLLPDESQVDEILRVTEASKFLMGGAKRGS